MKVSEISVTLSRKVSDGDYGSFGADVMATAELEEGEKLSSAMSTLTKRLAAQLEAAVAGVTPDMTTKKRK